MTDTPASRTAFKDAVLIALIWCVFMGVALVLRPLLPIDETRYVTVAWEMWTNDNFLVPHLNGELYSHKPPLLFWLMKLGWMVFGVSETWARLVAPLFGVLSLWLTAKLARELWPDVSTETQDTLALMAPLMMVSGLYWAVFSTMTMFDMLLTASALVGILGIVKAWRGFICGCGFWLGMLICGLGLGLGGFAKGPAALLHVLPVALTAPLWGPALGGPALAPKDPATSGGWGKWYAGVLLAILIGFAIVLAWAIPAAIQGGPEYRDAIFLKQSTERMVQSFAHRRPVYWFLWVLPLMLLPWTLWPRLWKGIGFRKAWRANEGLKSYLGEGQVRLLGIWFLTAFVAFSAISGKQPHYLLPEFPALALFAAYLLTRPKSGDAHTNERGHRGPVVFLAILAGIAFAGLMAKDLIEPMLAKPLPEWTAAAHPMWLLPGLIIALAAIWARANSPQNEARLIALVTVSIVAFTHLAAGPAFTLAYDLHPTAQDIKAIQDQGRPVAYVGKYHGEFQFLGRLEQPLAVFNTEDEARAWAQDHPDGVIVDTLRESDIDPANPPISLRHYRGKVLGIWNAAGF